jgi:hypothetical protein
MAGTANNNVKGSCRVVVHGKMSGQSTLIRVSREAEALGMMRFQRANNFYL